MADTVTVTQTSSEGKLNKLTRWGLYGLGAQFVLGNVVAFWHIPPSEETAAHKSPLLANISFDLHMLLALGLVVLSIFLIIEANKQHSSHMAIVRQCLGSVVGAFIGGTTIFWAPEWLIPWGLFLMGIGFLGAFVGYGRLFLALRQK